MTKPLQDFRPIHVVGVGLHRYQPVSETSYIELGLAAIRAALADACIGWEANESTFVGTALLGMASGRPMLQHLGANGRPIVHVENASASGSAAFRLACIEVASGFTDVAVAVGVDKPASRPAPAAALADPAAGAISLPTRFALLASEYAHAFGLTPEDLASVAVKNHWNGSLNAFAHRQKARTLGEVLASKPVSGMLTSLQCCPVGEGAAAAIVMSEAAIRRWDVPPDKPIRVSAFAAASEGYNDEVSEDARLTGRVTQAALAEAQISAKDLDVIELHDAFSIEEILYLEAMGLAPPGKAPQALRAGAFDIGGACAVSPSGGLIAMGHPIGPTGIGQIVEIALQLRRSAGRRQHPDARIGLAHMCGLGAVAYAHVLART